MKSSSVAISEWTQTTVREAVLELLREISQSKLSKLCQISQPLLSSIVNNKHDGKIGKRKCEQFGKWYYEYRKAHPIGVCGVSGSSSQTDNNTNNEYEAEKGRDLSLSQNSQCGETRLTFHASQEVPQLRQWFHVNPKPSDRILIKYAELLNQSSLRQERTKVTVKSLKNWWKNERQRERNLLKKNSKPNQSSQISKNYDPIQENHLLSCSGVDISITESRQSSEDEPTLTMAFTSDDNDEHIL